MSSFERQPIASQVYCINEINNENKFCKTRNFSEKEFNIRKKYIEIDGNTYLIVLDFLESVDQFYAFI